MRPGRLLLACALSLGALSAPNVARVRGDERPAEVRAEYAILRPGQAPEPLVLVRTAQRVEHRYLTRGVREIWRRDARGELEHEKLFPAEGAGVHYTEGDLRTAGIVPAWDALAGLLGGAQRAGLRVTGRRKATPALGAGPLVSLRGALRGQPARVEWLEALGLPAQLTLGSGARRVVLTLNAVAPCTPERCAEESADALRRIEFADLGDKEYDPFVRRFLAHDHAHALP